jgi:hypothetical protein
MGTVLTPTTNKAKIKLTASLPELRHWRSCKSLSGLLIRSHPSRESRTFRLARSMANSLRGKWALMARRQHTDRIPVAKQLETMDAATKLRTASEVSKDHAREYQASHDRLDR